MLRANTNITFTLVCDLSGKELGPFASRREALEAAGNAGWKQVGTIFVAPETAADMPAVLAKNAERVREVAPVSPVVSKSVPLTEAAVVGGTGGAK